MKTNPLTNKIKDINGKKIIRRYPKPDSHIRDKVEVALDLSNYASKRELDHVTSVDTSDLAAKEDFTTFKAEFDKLDINKLVNVPISLNNLKRNVDDLDVVDNEVVKNTKFNTLKTNVNNLEKKIPDATTIIHIN